MSLRGAIAVARRCRSKLGDPSLRSGQAPQSRFQSEVATIGGLGFIPKIPGTLGSAVGLAVMWLLSADPLYQLIGCGLAIALALWSAGPMAGQMGSADPSAIIIDEVAGMMVALVALPVHWKVYGAAFLLFRFLDIVKPPPIRRLEHLPGSWGILLDDLAAGLLTNVLLQVLAFFFLI